MEIAGRKVLVVGMEKSGVASAELLLRERARVTAADQKPFEALGESARKLRERGVEFQLQSEGGFDRFELVVLSPGVPFDAPEVMAARNAGVPVIGEVELATPFLKGRTIGITGSNGKTTTTALTGHILAEAGVPVQVGGNIGTPVTAMVATSLPDQWNVLELSSFQLETTSSFRPDVAMVLNITQNHLDRHRTMEAYAEAKARILDFQLPDDWAVLNAEDEWCVRVGSRGKARRVWFSSRRGAETDVQLENDFILYQGQHVMPIAKVPIRGLHNLENTMAAVAAARLAGVDLAAIASAVATFRAVEHRLEFVRSIDGVDFYNDSKATSVDATLKALSAFDGGLWVILGGKDKGSDYRPLRKPLATKARAALLIGSAAPKIASELEGALEMIPAGTLETAVGRAFDLAQPGDTVLLAPACASFDQFQSYEHRGHVFKEMVHRLPQKGAMVSDHGAKA